MNNLGYFRGAFVIAMLGLLAGFFVGGPSAVIIVAVLSILETSLSFDNAVVNATVLKDMDAVWRRRFLLWGMPLAVIGMRLAFPLLIVGAVASLGPIAVLRLAIEHPAEYAATLASAHHQIAAFGGAFLMMVFLKFFIDANKDEHWVHAIEAPLTRLGKLEAAEVVVTGIAILVSAAYLADVDHRLQFVTAGVLGVIAYILVDGLGALLGGEEGEAGAAVARTGLAGFLYLEMVDASFSFDGVIGAFALSDNLFIIAIGLGVGAMFVRSLTLMLVDKGTLASYRYLEHGAFWGIGALAVLMFVGVHVEIPEVVTGLLGAGLIGLSFMSSIRANRREAVAQSAA